MTERYDDFWAAYLGIGVSDWGQPGVSIRPHAGLKGYRGVWLFRHDARTVMSAPEGWVPFLSGVGLQNADAERLLQEAFLRGVFGADFDRSIGPTFHGSLEPTRFRPVARSDVRMLGPHNTPEIAALRLECGEHDWEASGLESGSVYRAGQYDNERLVSLAGYRPWSDYAGDLCVLMHPAHRGRGHGIRATSATTEAALRDGKLLLYQTLQSNVAATRIATALGFDQYATNVAVRLHFDVPSNSRLHPTGFAGG